MKVLVSWLRELVPTEATVAELARRLTLAGLEVEGEERLDAGLEEVVVAQVRSRDRIEGTKLSVCKVFDGTVERQVVCGADNYAAGDVVPLAKPGAVLPDGKVIGKAKLRGHDSEGMLCGGVELGADDGVDGLLQLSKELVLGTPIAKVLGKDDVRLELNVTPNRADALSHLGVARELSALLGTPLALPVPPAYDHDAPGPHVALVAKERCPRYATRLIEGIKVGPSPAWLRRKLEAVGQRSVNNVVDATNFVMFELGQPLHAFDLDRIQGGRIVVRTALEGEKLKTLDGVERTLSADDLLICDAERPVAIAGVMGGEESEVKENTTRLLLESAYFAPTSVRRTARRHGLHSEASHRFERGVDAEGMRRALDRLTQVLLDVAGGRVSSGTTDAIAAPHVRPEVALRHSRLQKVVGQEIPWAEATGILASLGLRVLREVPGETLFEVPPHRPDLSIEEDLIEEIARVRGFDAVPLTPLSGAGARAEQPPELEAIARVRLAVQAAGFDEAMNLAFVRASDPAALTPSVTPIALRNPLTEDVAVMRTTLLGGLLRNVAHNLRHGAKSLRLSELGRAYLPHEKAPVEPVGSATFQPAREPRRLAFVALGARGSGWTAGKDAVDFFDLKGAVEQVLESLRVGTAVWGRSDAPHLHPVSAASVAVGESIVGTAGELHPKVARAFGLPAGVFVAELELEPLLAASTLVPKFAELSKFPASTRDVAVVVDSSVPSGDVLAAIRDADDECLVEDAQLFDVYTGHPLPAGRKNLAFALRYRRADRTLNDAEVSAAHDRIVAALNTRFGAELRA